jgi:sporulation integral membrane protein YlbJ
MTYLLAAVLIFLVVFMVRFPDDAYKSAVDGLDVWWTVVFPALLPFFILSDMMMGTGVVDGMGVLLEPLMRPLFNVPGEGSFVFAMGLASGYPIGAVLAGDLVRQKKCTVTEGERLTTFTNTADPLFMIGAVAVGMFGDARIGIIIAASHYLASVIVGLVMAFYRRHDPVTPAKANTRREHLLARVLNRMHDARMADGRPFGKVLGDSVWKSVRSLLVIGGFIVLFSVISRMLTLAGVIGLIAAPVGGVLKLFGLDPSLASAAISGFFEIDIGCQAAARAAAPLAQRVILSSAIIAWSGFSVLAQVAAVTDGTRIRLAPYCLGRVLHALCAGAIAWFMWTPIMAMAGRVAPAMAPTVPATGLQYLSRSLFVFGIVLGICLAAGLVVALIRRIKLAVFWVR